jgi:outer membrane protein OmpA-like peptidoglycan-associated protein
MTVPTIESQIVTVSRPKLTGTWAEGVAKDLKVTVDGKVYMLGQSETLTSDGAGRWSLTLDQPLRDGIYEILVETADASGNTKTDRTKDELIVDAAPPATPTVRLLATELSPVSISGTWAEGDAVSLEVGLEGVTAALGADRNLRSDGHGTWTLNLNRTLDPGSYDVVVTSKDGRGRVSSDQTKFEIFVKGVEEAKPVPETAPIDCQSEFNTVLTVEGIRFGSDAAALHEASLATIAKLAAIAAHCPDKTIEIGGHTDSTGSAEYNLALSEHRAVAVRDAMIAAGADGARLIAKGYGEASPLATNGTEQGRMVNRRIEFKILN